MTVSKSTTPDSFAPLYVNSYQATDTSLKLGHGTHFHDVGGGVYRGTGGKQFVAGDADPTTLDLHWRKTKVSGENKGVRGKQRCQEPITSFTV